MGSGTNSEMNSEMEFLTVAEVAKILGVTQKAVRDFIAAGELAASKIGQWRITQESLRSFIDLRSNRAVKKFLDEATPREPGTLSVYTVIDYYTENASPLTKRLVEYVNSQPKGTTFKWTFTWDQGTGRARYVVSGTPCMVRGLLDIIDKDTR